MKNIVNNLVAKNVFVHYQKFKKGRRGFIGTSLKAAGAAAFAGMPMNGIVRDLCAEKEYAVQDVINVILKEIPGAPFAQTVDTIKSGSATNKVSGIVTTMFPTVEVIRTVVRLNANFIIAHEPVFYNHEDKLDYVPNNAVVKQKMALLQKHNITVWRFHDYWHAHKPDGIGYGVLKTMGWLPYYEPGKMVVKIPGLSLGDIANHLKSKLDIARVRVIGNLGQRCERIGILPGAAGGEMQISLVENEKPDVLVVGEVHEWETAEYIRDSLALGRITSLVDLGHSVSEEPGMGYLAEWLRPKVPGLNIVHVRSGNPFIFV
ncbi:MAG: Nif3-like dinuclear metal center hexameric protein [Bacteroidetes bacterium]|nr:Nif3-like dinuclear metal center hexameric protein [Bacteroidota bacterium]